MHSAIAPELSKIVSDSAIMSVLTQIFQSKMSGIIRYLHYSFMVSGKYRLLFQPWFQQQAQGCLEETNRIGEKIVALGGHPPMGLLKIEETHLHTPEQMLQESLAFEMAGFELYRELAELAYDKGDFSLEELSRNFARVGSEHIDNIRKMLKSR